MKHVGLQGGHGTGWRLVPPQLTDQVGYWYGLVGMKQQQCEHGEGLGCGRSDRTTAAYELKGAEDANGHIGDCVHVELASCQHRDYGDTTVMCGAGVRYTP